MTREEYPQVRTRWLREKEKNEKRKSSLEKTRESFEKLGTKGPIAIATLEAKKLGKNKATVNKRDILGYLLNEDEETQKRLGIKIVESKRRIKQRKFAGFCGRLFPTST